MTSSNRHPSYIQQNWFFPSSRRCSLYLRACVSDSNVDTILLYVHTITLRQAKAYP